MDALIYIVEDDNNIKEVMKLALQNSYQIITFDNGKSAIEAIRDRKPDLVIFDLMLPELDGMSAIKYLRANKYNFPIMIVSAKNQEIDKVSGLDGGANDYLTKPFGILELQARVRNLLKNYQDKTDLIKSGDLVLYQKLRQAKVGDEVIDLTKKEYNLLAYLLVNRDRVVDREELLNQIWGLEYIGETRVLDVHIRSLRKKLNRDYIQTVRGFGYRFVEQTYET